MKTPNIPSTPTIQRKRDGKEEIKKHCKDVVDEFINQFLLDLPADGDAYDFVRNHSLCLLQYYFILCKLKDAVHEDNGDRFVTLHKQLLLHFKAVPGFNTYAIEMLINVVQNTLFLSPAQAHTNAFGHQQQIGKAELERMLKLISFKRTKTET